eukprot:gene31297-38668_t
MGKRQYRPNATDGCKRKLVRDNYVEHKELPYCKPCYDKLFKSWVKDTKAASSLTLENLLINKKSSARLIVKNLESPTHAAPSAPSAAASENAPTASEDLSASIAERVIASNSAAEAAHLFVTPIKKPADADLSTDDASIVPVTPAPSSATGGVVAPNKSYIVGKTTAFNGANKCVKCAKTVYKMEEIIAVGQVWHNSCFCCGGLHGDGCNKTLTRDNYVDHNQQPYCNSCYNKQFRTKGFGYGNTFNTNFGGAN